jgi:probable HAF family extracellular repeat protein
MTTRSQRDPFAIRKDAKTMQSINLNWERRFLMKRIGIMTLILFVGLISMAWAQQQALSLQMGKHGIPSHRPFNALSRSSATTTPSITTQVATAPTAKVYDLGHYPGGTYAEMVHINDFGVAVGLGDTPSGYGECTDPLRGYTRPVGVPLFGPRAMQWFDLGTLGGESCPNEWFPAATSAAEISNTGLIVGLAPKITDLMNPPPAHAFAWTAKSGMIDLGTLEDLGYDWSVAIGVNKLGTLIVGSSGQTGGKSLAVVWTPEVVWTSHGPARTWKIHALDTTGFEQIPNWTANTVNDLGQIVGIGFSDSGPIAALWTPVAGKGWIVKQLDSPKYPISVANDINDRGEIVGCVAPADASVYIPALWQPVGRNGKTWRLTVLANLPGTSAELFGINDLGDIVGTAWDANWNPSAVCWTTTDPNSVRPIGFPGDWGYGFKINNLRIAVGGYGVGEGPELAVAVQIR